MPTLLASLGICVFCASFVTIKERNNGRGLSIITQVMWVLVLFQISLCLLFLVAGG